MFIKAHIYSANCKKTNTVFFLIERKLKNMNLIISALLTLLWLSAPGSVIIASGQRQKTNVRILEGGCDLQCPSVEEREATRNEIIQIANSAILNATGLIPSCSGTPGWRRVAFINMTDSSYNCPTGLSLTS